MKGNTWTTREISIWTIQHYVTVLMWKCLGMKMAFWLWGTHPCSWEASDWLNCFSWGLFAVGKLPRNKYFSNDWTRSADEEGQIFQNPCFYYTCSIYTEGCSKAIFFLQRDKIWMRSSTKKWVIFLFFPPIFPPEKECQWKTCMN